MEIRGVTAFNFHSLPLCPPFALRGPFRPRHLGEPQIQGGVSLLEEEATCHCSTKALLFEEGSPMYTILETGVCFLSVRWSGSACSSAAALRGEVPVVPPGCIIRQRAAHISVSMASRTTRAWKVRTFLSALLGRTSCGRIVLGASLGFARSVPSGGG